MNVLVICAAGMTSSVLVKRMRDTVQEHKMAYKIAACSMKDAEMLVSQADIVLIAPQIAYFESELKNGFPSKRIVLIDAMDYVNQDALKILESMTKDNTETKKSHAVKISSIIGTNKALRAINDAFVTILPITMIGSVFCLVMNLPFPGYAQLLERTALNAMLELGVDMTLDIISLYVVFFVGYYYGRSLKCEASLCGLNALICFMLFASGGQILIDNLGSQGLFCAFIVGIIATRIYKVATSFSPLEDNMANDIPSAVIKSLSAIVPIFISLVSFMFVYGMFSLVFHQSFMEYTKHLLTRVCESYVSNSIYSYLIILTFGQLLWFFGIHGGNITGLIVNPIILTFAYANLEAFHLGQPLPYVITTTFKTFLMYGGAGSTLSLCCLLAFFAKSQRLKQLGTLSLPMSIFNINEPILFGLPIVMNPTMLVPFFAVPLVSNFLTYLVMEIGIVPRLNWYSFPFSTPGIFVGLAAGGIRAALWFIILLALQTLGWYPFFKIIDNQYYKEENKAL